MSKDILLPFSISNTGFIITDYSELNNFKYIVETNLLILIHILSVNVIYNSKIYTLYIHNNNHGRYRC